MHNAVGIISKVDRDTGKCTVKLDHMREGRFVEAEVLLGSCIDATSDFTFRCLTAAKARYALYLPTWGCSLLRVPMVPWVHLRQPSVPHFTTF
jgi:hypothetical protein